MRKPGKPKATEAKKAADLRNGRCRTLRTFRVRMKAAKKAAAVVVAVVPAALPKVIVRLQKLWQRLNPSRMNGRDGLAPKRRPLSAGIRKKPMNSKNPRLQTRTTSETKLDSPNSMRLNVSTPCKRKRRNPEICINPFWRQPTHRNCLRWQ